MYYQPPCSLYSTHNSTTGHLSSSPYTASYSSASIPAAAADQGTASGTLRTAGPTSTSIGIATTDDKEIKGQFLSPEGVYKMTVMTVSELYRPSARAPLNSTTLASSNAPVRVSFLRVHGCNCLSAIAMHNPRPSSMEVNGGCESQLASTSAGNSDKPTESHADGYAERICFNVGREIYVYEYGAGHSAPDFFKLIDKRIYKGTFPTSHAFNEHTASATSCSLIIGFSAGQVQLIDPYQKEYQSSKLFNDEERLVDKSAVTCLRWVPGESSLFIAAHASGNMYVYNEKFGHCPQVAPTYQLVKQGEGYSVFTGKSKTQKNPMAKWQIGEGASLNQFEFSNNGGTMLATVGQDGFLRVFDYKGMELVGYFKSYFGGLLCMAWSLGNDLIATGGEDDLLTVYSVREKRVLCRGQGHKSWISQVAFDPFVSNLHNSKSIVRVPSTDLMEVDKMEVNSHKQNNFFGGINGDEQHHAAASSSSDTAHLKVQRSCGAQCPNSSALSSHSDPLYGHETEGRLIYRIGTVGHDTQLCLWDLPLELINEPSASSGHRDEHDGCHPGLGHSYSTALHRNGKATTVITIEPFDKSEAALPSETPTTSPASTIALPSSEAAETNGNVTNAHTLPTSSSSRTKTKKTHKRGLSFGSRLVGGLNRSNRTSPENQPTGGAHHGDNLATKGKRVMGKDSIMGIFGTELCPRMDDPCCAVIEPIVCKKISQERLTVLHFREAHLVTASQDGYVCTWARPAVRRAREGKT